MEEKEEKKNFSKVECIGNNDADFCSFYYKAVKRLLDIDNKANVSYLYRYDKILIKYYDIFCHVKSDLEDQDDSIINLLKGSLYYRLIYFYRNATLFSSAVAFHFQNIYTQDPNVMKRLIKKKIVKICSIGGCSAPGIVAIITVLKSIALKNDIELDFRVTVIDFNADWKNTCITVLSCLEEFHEATWKINFIESDLAKTKAWTPEILKTIQEADVVTMVRLISNLKVKRNIVKMICNELQTQGIFIILDRPLIRLIQLYFGITNLGDFHLIHAELCDYHTLDIEAVKQFKTLYQKHFGDERKFKSNVSGNLFVSVWIKASSETDAKYKDILECIFQTNAEKYNPKQGFLSHNALTRWENLFTKKKVAAGWSAKSIKKFVKKQKEIRNNIFGKYIPQKKGVDSLQNHLLTQVGWLENDRKEFRETNEKSLNEYLRQKRQYSLMKKNAYFSSLSAHNLCSFLE
ncbi:hypothetical protein AVEN_196260-1 [Araneus ventricosus]|uniref:Uncharacterized protein n=1 Tax=Araneus ventricosus TaxID=182803 RepID=A0A4Y2HZ87_ARAVE|nr:hypothetical protein AVEN_196260-1 [Araneus ventricosus]